MFFLFGLARALDPAGSIALAWPRRNPEYPPHALMPARTSKAKSRLCSSWQCCAIADEFYVIRKTNFYKIWLSTWISRILLPLKDNSVTSKMKSNPFIHIN